MDSEFARRVWRIQIVQTPSGQLAKSCHPNLILQTLPAKSGQSNFRRQERALADLDRGGLGNVGAELRGELGEVVGEDLRVM